MAGGYSGRAGYVGMSGRPGNHFRLSGNGGAFKRLGKWIRAIGYRNEFQYHPPRVRK